MLALMDRPGSQSEDEISFPTKLVHFDRKILIYSNLFALSDLPIFDLSDKQSTDPLSKNQQGRCSDMQKWLVSMQVTP